MWVYNHKTGVYKRLWYFTLDKVPHKLTCLAVVSIIPKYTGAGIGAHLIHTSGPILAWLRISSTLVYVCNNRDQTIKSQFVFEYSLSESQAKQLPQWCHFLEKINFENLVGFEWFLKDLVESGRCTLFGRLFIMYLP